jgi:hypothetical protein
VCECLLFVMLYMLVCHLISRLCFVFVVFVRKQLLSLLEIWCLRNLLVLQNCTQCCM